MSLVRTGLAPEGTLFHHGADQPCVWAVDGPQRKDIRTLDQHKMRSVWSVNGPFGRQDHKYSHLASVLPRVLREEVDYDQQKYYVEDMVDEDQQELTCSAVLAVGGLAIRVPPAIKRMSTN